MLKPLFLFFLLTTGLSVWGSESAVPRFELIGSETRDLGRVECFEKKTVFFRLKNTGTAPGVIQRLVPTCSCISGTADKTWVQPQEETEIRIVLDPTAIHGTFKRVLWVYTTATASGPFSLTLKGEILPLFNGLPESPQQIVLPESAAWTNRFTLTEAATNLFPGTPVIDTDTNKLRATASIVPHTAQGKTSFTVTLAVTALVSGRHTLHLSLPVKGRPNLSPIKLAFHIHVGLELKTIPGKILLTPTGESLTRQLTILTVDKQIMTTDKNLATNALTWTPRREGVSLQVQQNPKTLLLTVTLTLSPEAVTNLMKETNPQLIFHYPNYKPVSVTFFSRSETSTNTVNAAKDR